MKSDTITTVLNLVLAVFVVLGVAFALLTIFRVREFRTVQLQASFANNALMRVQALANDAAAYNQSKQDPNITRLLQSIQAKPAAPAK